MIQEGPQYFLRHRYYHLVVLRLLLMNITSSAHIKSPRYAHQLYVMYLHLLKHTAYSAYCYAVHGTAESQQVWEQLSRTEIPQFKYWPTIAELELMMCRFIRSLREGHFRLYVQVCDELCQFMCGICFSCLRHIRIYTPNF